MHINLKNINPMATKLNIYTYKHKDNEQIRQGMNNTQAHHTN